MHNSAAKSTSLRKGGGVLCFTLLAFPIAYKHPHIWKNEHSNLTTNSYVTQYTPITSKSHGVKRGSGTADIY